MMDFVHILLIILVTAHYNSANQQHQPQEQQPPNERKHVQILLNERSWEEMLKGEWLVGFCVPLVPNCFQFERTWIKLAQEMEQEQQQQQQQQQRDQNKPERNITVASMELNYSETLVRRFSLQSLPTILHVKDGVFRQLPVSYKVKEIKDVILSDCWMKTKTLPFWRHPNGWIVHIIILYIKLIDEVYESQYLAVEYDQATWLVHVCLMLIVTIAMTIVFGICSIICKLFNRCRPASRRGSPKKLNKSHPMH
ncbi:thioredoxin-related transmembrane protein 4-like [Drosophila tropicalis]|uniref:thioredoxin-related transmembrane protein 4-like n=1 Tax=Drosophila tropicalis TaxID=46794 RepID=UPI0035AB8736